MLLPCILDDLIKLHVIGASLSKPHTYEVVGEMFVCNHDVEHSTDNLQPFQGSDVTCNTWC